MAFLGFNTAEENHVDKLCEYVREGGKLLLGWCHLYTDTDRDDAIRGIPHPIDAERLTGVRLKGFLPEKDGVSVGEIAPGENVEVLREKDGQPLLIRHCIGRGEVYL